jgi:hypothetical protein
MAKESGVLGCGGEFLCFLFICGLIGIAGYLYYQNENAGIHTLCINGLSHSWDGKSKINQPEQIPPPVNKPILPQDTDEDIKAAEEKLKSVIRIWEDWEYIKAESKKGNFLTADSSLPLTLKEAEEERIKREAERARKSAEEKTEKEKARQEEAKKAEEEKARVAEAEKIRSRFYRNKDGAEKTKQTEEDRTKEEKAKQEEEARKTEEAKKAEAELRKLGIVKMNGEYPVIEVYDWVPSPLFLRQQQLENETAKLKKQEDDLWNQQMKVFYGSAAYIRYGAQRETLQAKRYAMESEVSDIQIKLIGEKN